MELARNRPLENIFLFTKNNPKFIERRTIMASYYRRKNGTYCIRVSRGKPGGKQDLVSTTYDSAKKCAADALAACIMN